LSFGKLGYANQGVVVGLKFNAPHENRSAVMVAVAIVVPCSTLNVTNSLMIMSLVFPFKLSVTKSET
jgi:hypothetical protein